MCIGALLSLSKDSRIASKSFCLESFPVRSFHASTFAWAASILSTSCWLLISRENIPTVILLLTAACLAISSAREVLPIEGLAARIIRSDFCRPASLLSISTKPVEIPLMACSPECSRSSLSHASSNSSLICTNLCAVLKFVTSKSFFSALSSISSSSFVSS